MSSEQVGFTSLGVMILINLIITVYNYGRLTERVTSAERRINNLEHGTNVCMGHTAIDTRIRECEVAVKSNRCD